MKTKVTESKDGKYINIQITLEEEDKMKPIPPDNFYHLTFDDLLSQINKKEITLNGDIAFALFNKIGDTYQKGSWDRRNAFFKLADMLAIQWHSKSDKTWG